MQDLGKKMKWKRFVS